MNEDGSTCSSEVLTKEDSIQAHTSMKKGIRKVEKFIGENKGYKFAENFKRIRLF
jgi:hypothetical protein